MNYCWKFLQLFLWMLIGACGADEPLSSLSKVIPPKGQVYVVGLPQHPTSKPSSALVAEIKPLTPRDSSLHLASVEFSANASEEEIAAFLAEGSESGAFEFVEKNDSYELFQAGEGLGEEEENRAEAHPPAKVFNLIDRLYSRTSPPWWLRLVKLPPLLSALAAKEAQLADDATLVAQSPVIAVLDSGADYSHPGLRIWDNPLAGKAGCSHDRWGCDATRGEGTLLGVGPALPF